MLGGHTYVREDGFIQRTLHKCYFSVHTDEFDKDEDELILI